MSASTEAPMVLDLLFVPNDAAPFPAYIMPTSEEILKFSPETTEAYVSALVDVRERYFAKLNELGIDHLKQRAIERAAFDGAVQNIKNLCTKLLDACSRLGWVAGVDAVASTGVLTVHGHSGSPSSDAGPESTEEEKKLWNV